MGIGSIIWNGRSFCAEARKKKDTRKSSLHKTFARRKAAEARKEMATAEMRKPGAFKAALTVKSAGRHRQACTPLGHVVDLSVAEASGIQDDQGAARVDTAGRQDPAPLCNLRGARPFFGPHGTISTSGRHKLHFDANHAKP